MGTGQEIARAEAQASEDMFERRKVLRALAVPTDDTKVRERLRAMALPMTLFGERVGVYALPKLNAQTLLE